MKAIELRSDTFTQPTPEMREAMHRAEVGDDMYGEDPTVNRLQEQIAEMLGKEAALFVPSGTMGNLISLLTHCQRGEQAIVGSLSHIEIFEQGGASALGGISRQAIANLPDGTMDFKTLAHAIEVPTLHTPRTSVVCLENTWHGNPLPPGFCTKVGALAKERGLKVHLDGARLFNAAVATGTKPAQLAQDADSVQVCFSKGLAAPVGSAVCGSKEFIAQAQRARQILGGGMRQCGVLAAACIVALNNMVDRLAEDHANAKLLADGLAQMPQIKIAAQHLSTNIVLFDLADENSSADDFVAMLAQNGVNMSYEPRLGIRAVTHYQISKDDISVALDRIRQTINSKFAASDRQQAGMSRKA